MYIYVCVYIYMYIYIYIRSHFGSSLFCACDLLPAQRGDGTRAWRASLVVPFQQCIMAAITDGGVDAVVAAVMKYANKGQLKAYM